MKLSTQIVACLVGLFVGASTMHAALTLYDAIDAGDLAAVQRVLEADKLAKTVDGRTLNIANGDTDAKFSDPAFLTSKGLSPALRPIHFAVIKDNPDILRALIEADADVNALDGLGGKTPLYLAVQKDNPACIEELLKAPNINVHQVCDGLIKLLPGYTALQLAVLHDKTACIAALLQFPNIVTTSPKSNPFGGTLLHLVQSPEALKLLRDAGADTFLTEANNLGDCPLHHVVQTRGDNAIELLTAFLAIPGVDVNIQNLKGETPLCYAESPEQIKILIAAGAEVNKVSFEGKTPLERQMQRHDDKKLLPIIEIFAQAGAEFPDKNFDMEPNIVRALYGDNIDTIRALLKVKNIKNFLDREECKNGSTPLMAAINAKRTSVAQLLIESGADVTKGISGGNILHYAALAGHAEIIPTLKKAGLDINELSKGFSNQQTALGIAVEKNDRALVTALLDAGADIERPTGNYRSTPLHLAKNFPEMRELLIQRGANINAQDGAGFTPLARAVESRSIEATKYFVAQGARTDIKTTVGNQTVFDLAQDQPELQQALGNPTPTPSNPTQSPSKPTKAQDNLDTPDAAEVQETFFGVNKNIVRGGLCVTAILAAFKNWSAFTQAKKYILAKNKAAAARNEAALIRNESELNQRAFKRVCKKHTAALALLLGSSIGTITSCVM